MSLTVDVEPGGSIPRTTRWHLVISDCYPHGSIEVFPSKEGGIAQTFQHQVFNDVAPDSRPWRTGKICPETPAASLRQLGYDEEPRSAAVRLKWFVCRSIRWIELASRDALVGSGDPFELPDYPRGSRVRLAFDETRATLAAWSRSEAVQGYARLVRLPGDGFQLAVRSFEDDTGREIVQASWGRWIEEQGEEEPVAAWIRCPGVLVLEPWQAPTTWGELSEAFEAQGVDLFASLRALVPKLRNPSGRRNRSPRLLLVGFPIPETIDGPGVRLHWLPIQLPPLSSGQNFRKGFRADERGWWAQDRLMHFKPGAPVAWGVAESWADREIGSRGYLPEAIREQNTILLGAGALGSAVAEILVRAGLKSLAILDADRLQAGNLVRHTLLLQDVEEAKAECLADRLNAASPHANVEANLEGFPPKNRELLEQCAQADLVIDCTADQDVLSHLQDFEWKEECLLTCFALNLGASRLYCFATRGGSFPREAYEEAVNPWILDDLKGRDLADLPREGLGCWHPVFPARADDIWLIASAAAKFLVKAAQTPLNRPDFAVFECSVDEDGTFLGIVRRGECPDGAGTDP